MKNISKEINEQLKDSLWQLNKDCRYSAFNDSYNDYLWKLCNGPISNLLIDSLYWPVLFSLNKNYEKYI